MADLDRPTSLDRLQQTIPVPGGVALGSEVALSEGSQLVE
jgi:hypothetical protein